MSFHAIVVDAKDEADENSCFVVRPKGSKEDKIAQDVRNALVAILGKSINITEILDDLSPDFAQKIHRGIRAATLVVVISPPIYDTVNPTLHHFNDNVMIELGIALALGKPILLITSGPPGTLPANIAKHGYLRYNIDSSRTDLYNAILQLKMNNKGPIDPNLLIDEFYNREKGYGIRQVTTQYRIFLEPEVWNSLLSLLRFVENLLVVFSKVPEALDVIYGNLQKANSVSVDADHPGIFSREEEQCKKSWDEFTYRYKVTIKEFIRNFSAENSKINDVCKRLVDIANSAEQEIPKNIFSNIQEEYKRIIGHMDGNEMTICLNDYHDDITSLFKGGLRETGDALVELIGGYRNRIENLLKRSHAIIQDLLRLTKDEKS